MEAITKLRRCPHCKEDYPDGTLHDPQCKEKVAEKTASRAHNSPISRALAVERRERVFKMFFQEHRRQGEIAALEGVSQTTISQDVSAILKKVQNDIQGPVERWVAKEVTELWEMERDAALQFIATKDVKFLDVRLRIKKRRADMLGLDAPKTTILTGPGGGPIQHEFDLRHLSDQELFDATCRELPGTVLEETARVLGRGIPEETEEVD